MKKSKIISGAVAAFLAITFVGSLATASMENQSQNLISCGDETEVSTTSEETVSKAVPSVAEEGENLDIVDELPANSDGTPKEATIEGVSDEALITELPDASTYTVSPVAANAPMNPPKITTVLQPLKSGWNDQLSVWNNLKRSASYGRVVTDDAYTIVCRNVEAEMGADYCLEALKAQAITAYSFIKYQKKPPSLPLADNVSDIVKYAVSCVSGYAVMYDGYYAQTVYGASCSGVTASAKEIWGAYIPYLISLPCQVDAIYNKADYGNSTYYKSAEIARYVKAYTGITLTGDPNTWFELIRSPAGYVSYVGIGGKGYVTGENFRMRVMDYQIKSENLYINYDAATDTFIMTTFGYGHGVGMSQTAAHYLGKYYGWGWQQIVHYFYPGVYIEQVAFDTETDTATSDTEQIETATETDTETETDLTDTQTDTDSEVETETETETETDTQTETDSESTDTENENTEE